MINFANAQYLLLLLLIPVFIIIQVIVLKLRRRRIRRFGDERLVSQMMPSYSSVKTWLRLSFFILGFFFFVLGLSRPQIGATVKERETKGAEIMIVLDVSNSMLAEDYMPNRLERAKLAIERLVDKLRDDRIGLIVFAGSSFVQLPVTADYVSAKMFLNSISTGSVPIQGTAIGDAIKTAVKSFSTQSEKSRAIIVITDGENHEDDPVAAATQAAELGIRVFAIGVGSPEGVPIKIDGEFIKDESGEMVVSRLNEELLQEVAEMGNGGYLRASSADFGLSEIVNEIEKMDKSQFSYMTFEEYNEHFYWILWVALGLLVIEGLLLDRRNPRLRQFNIFEK